MWAKFNSLHKSLYLQFKYLPNQQFYRSNNMFACQVPCNVSVYIVCLNWSSRFPVTGGWICRWGHPLDLRSFPAFQLSLFGTWSVLSEMLSCTREKCSSHVDNLYYLSLELYQFCDCVPVPRGINWTVTDLDKHSLLVSLGSLFPFVSERSVATC